MSTTHFHIREHTVPTQHIRRYPRATLNSGDELQLALKQYIPKTNTSPSPGDITILAAHANGVGKELYEPLFDDLFERLSKSGKSDVRIRGIWISDVAWQGQSSVLNEDKLGNDPSWYDHPLDLLQLTNIFRKEMPQPIFGMGHSLGGNNIVNVSLMHPALFSGIILMDPVLQRSRNTENTANPAYMSTFRRDIWPSRQEAADSFKKNAFYKRYDPRVMEKHIQYSLRDLPTKSYPEAPAKVQKSSRKPELETLASVASTSAAPVPPSSLNTTPVTLRTPKAQEVFTFMRPKFPPDKADYSAADLKVFDEGPPPRTRYPDIPVEMRDLPFYSPAPLITFDNLPFLRPRVLYVFADESFMSTPDQVESKMSATGTGVGGSRYAGASDASPTDVETAVQHVMIKEAGHFMAFERPAVVADHIGEWLTEEMARWWRETIAEREEWERIKRSEDGKGGTAISSQYAAWMQGDGEANGIAKPRRPKGDGSKI